MAFQLKLVFILIVLFVCFVSIYPVSSTITNPNPAKGCGMKYGCHKGSCWSSCSAVAGVVQTFIGNHGSDSGEWCYTTKGRSQSHEWVSCSRDDECDPCNYLWFLLFFFVQIFIFFINFRLELRWTLCLNLTIFEIQLKYKLK